MPVLPWERPPDEVIDGVDLPAIIRESTSTVTAEVMTDVRGQTARADVVVSTDTGAHAGTPVTNGGIVSRGLAGIVDVLVVASP